MPPQRVRFVVGFCWTVGVLGIALAALVVGYEGLAACGTAAFLFLFVALVLGELVPLELPLRGRYEELNLSTPFAFAMLMSVGLAPALVAQAAASLLQDVVARKPIWRSVFNVGQYAVSLAAAGAVLSAMGVEPRALADAMTPAELIAMMVAGGVFFLVNFLIVGTAVAAYQSTSLRTHLGNDAKTTALMAGVSTSLAPLVLAAVDRNPVLVALFLLPFVAVHWSGRMARDNAHQALHDALTGLPNRTRFRLVVNEAISAGGADGHFAVMLLDLNRFKDINDTLGHHYGDRILRAVAVRLREQIRGGDVVARLGGDEFAILVRSDQPGAIAQRLSDSLRPAMDIDDFLLDVDASVGTAVYPTDGADVETLLRRADVAMYNAKERHLGHVAYTKEIDQYEPEHLALVSDLRRAVDGDELVVHYQPMLDLQRGGIRGVEALVRWEHPRLGLLQPGAFIEMAEHTGLVKPLTNRVLALALQQCAAWQAEGIELQVSVNVSPRSLLDPALRATVAGTLTDAGLEASRLKLEITESAIMVDPEAALRVLEELAAMGVALSIDDFGTGYSSLAYLKRLPATEMKIDRSFVQNMARDGGDHAIVRSTIDMAANLGLNVVAEGVEERETLNELRRLGCDVAQGYIISRPIPAAELRRWLGEQKGRLADASGAVAGVAA